MNESFVWVDPERMGGAPCFRGTRVPVDNLFDYLQGGNTLAEFLDDFPGVSREQVQAALGAARRNLFTPELLHAAA